MIQDVNVGTLPNDGTGDLLRDAFIILNNNIQELVDKDVLLDSDISDINTLLGSLQTQINGKAPLVHSHIISDITGLQTILDGKVDETAYISDIATINTSITNILTTLSGLGAVAYSNDYNDLDNIPTTFTPNYHTHTEADISDLDKYTRLEVDTMFGALGDLANLDQVDTTQIVTHAVTNAKLAQMNANTVKGRLSGNGTPQDVSMLDLPISTDTQNALDNKQDTLVSGTNIKTINGTSILGSGDITIVGGSNTQIINQTSDISSNTTTLVNTGITFEVEANSVYRLDGWLIGGGNSSGGIRIMLSLPAGCSGRHGIGISANINVGIANQISPFAAASNIQQSLYNGILITGANAGTVTLQFSSAIGGQTGWFRTDSVLTVTKK